MLYILLTDVALGYELPLKFAISAKNTYKGHRGDLVPFVPFCYTSDEKVARGKCRDVQGFEIWLEPCFDLYGRYVASIRLKPADVPDRLSVWLSLCAQNKDITVSWCEVVNGIFGELRDCP